MSTAKETVLNPQATPGERILLAQLHQLQRALEQSYADRRQQEAETAVCAQKVQALEVELAQLKAHLSAILTSRSWRITAPLRRLFERQNNG